MTASGRSMVMAPCTSEREPMSRPAESNAGTSSPAATHAATTSRPSWPPAPLMSTRIYSPALAFNGSHHQRLSRYQATVSARPCSNECSIFQPRALILSMLTE